MPLPSISGGYAWGLKMVSTGWFGVCTGAVFGIGGGEEDAANAVAEAWTQTGSLWTFQSENINYDSVQIQKMDGVSDSVEFAWASLSGLENSGGASGVPSAPQVCGLQTLRSGGHGRRGRGRLYVPGIAVSIVDEQDGVIAAANQAAWQAHGEEFRRYIDEDSSMTYLAVWSRTDNALYEVQTTVGRAYLGTQRRRAGRVAG